MMKAIECTKYGSPDVLEFEEVQKPMPGNDEVLIKVEVAAAKASDWHLMRTDSFMIRL